MPEQEQSVKVLPIEGYDELLAACDDVKRALKTVKRVRDKNRRLWRKLKDRPKDHEAWHNLKQWTYFDYVLCRLPESVGLFDMLLGSVRPDAQGVLKGG